jgi:polysaccharide biosynthesis/export protein VpsN
MPRFRLAFLILTITIVPGCELVGRNPALAPAPSAQRVPDLSAYRLGIGDRVRIDVFGEADLSIETAIDGTGRINYPLLGSVPASHRTAGELQEAITTGLASGYLRSPDVRVAIVQYRPFYIVGQVRKAGAYPFVIGLTVEKALALAGGLTNLASTRRIYVLREEAPGNQRIRVSLDALVFPGDTLLVEESLF